MHPSVFSWWPLLLVVTAASPAGAQSNPALASPPIYRSALEGYQPFGDQPVAPWKASNDTVGRIGGWRAYAQEASEEIAQERPPSVVPAQAGTQRDAPALPKAEVLDSRLRGNDGN